MGSKQSLNRVQNLRLSSTVNLRKTRSRLLRLLVQEESSTIDLPYWTLVFRQLDALGRDFEREENLRLAERIRRLELLLENQPEDPIEKQWRELNAGLRKAASDSG